VALPWVSGRLASRSSRTRVRPRLAPPNPPLRSWTVEGFKSIVSAAVELRPLTIVVGANSSGKSSLLQSLLIAAQAASIGVRGNVVPMHGPLVSVGRFADAVCATGGRHRRTTIGGWFR